MATSVLRLNVQLQALSCTKSSVWHCQCVGALIAWPPTGSVLHCVPCLEWDSVCYFSCQLLTRQAAYASVFPECLLEVFVFNVLLVTSFQLILHASHQMQSPRTHAGCVTTLHIHVHTIYRFPVQGLDIGVLHFLYPCNGHMLVRVEFKEHRTTAPTQRALANSAWSLISSIFRSSCSAWMTLMHRQLSR